MKYVFPKLTRIAIYIKGNGISKIKKIRLTCEVKMRVFLENLRKKYAGYETGVLFYQLP